MEAAPPLALAYWCRCPRGCNRAGNGDCCYCDLCYHDGTWCKCNCEGCRAPAPPLFTVQESWDAYGEEDSDSDSDDEEDKKDSPEKAKKGSGGKGMAAGTGVKRG